MLGMDTRQVRDQILGVCAWSACVLSREKSPMFVVLALYLIWNIFEKFKKRKHFSFLILSLNIKIAFTVWILTNVNRSTIEGKLYSGNNFLSFFGRRSWKRHYFPPASTCLAENRYFDSHSLRWTRWNHVCECFLYKESLKCAYMRNAQCVGVGQGLWRLYMTQLPIPFRRLLPKQEQR